VTEYCIERKNSIDPEKFVDHNTARGWMLGKVKMKDWKAAVRTWEKNDYGNSTRGTRQKTNAELTDEELDGKYAGVWDDVM
jgi:hypothetical protein